LTAATTKNAINSNKAQKENGKEEYDYYYDNNSPFSLQFERKLDLATSGLSTFIREHLLTKISRKNTMTIIGNVLAMKSEISLSDNYRRNNILTLKRLAESVVVPGGQKSFKDFTKEDVLAFLDKLRKPESADPLHKWQVLL